VRTFDVAVIGAGIGAGSLVYNLFKLGFRGSVLVVDRGGAVATGQTALSAGGFRNLWTTPINQQLCTRAIRTLKAFPEEMASAIGLRQCGYLFTYGRDSWARVPEAAQIWRANGVDFELLDPPAMEALIPDLRCAVDHVDPEVREFLGLEDLVGGVLGRECGSFDPSQAATAYFERALDRFPVRPQLQFHTQVETIRFDGQGRAHGLCLRDEAGLEETIEAGVVALCAGPWSNQLLRRSGLPESSLMPIASQKRMLFLTDPPDPDPRWPNIPLTIIDQGIYFKAEGGHLLIGKAKGDAPDSLDMNFEPEYYQDEINLIMQERMPGTARCKLKGGWAGLYDTTTPDHNAIVGWHADHPGLLLQVGYSGHGAMESPAVGLCLAELVMHGEFRTVDCTPLRWSRFREGDLVEERIVI